MSCGVSAPPDKVKVLAGTIKATEIGEARRKYPREDHIMEADDCVNMPSSSIAEASM